MPRPVPGTVTGLKPRLQLRPAAGGLVGSIPALEDSGVLCKDSVKRTCCLPPSPKFRLLISVVFWDLLSDVLPRRIYSFSFIVSRYSYIYIEPHSKKNKEKFRRRNDLISLFVL